MIVGACDCVRPESCGLGCLSRIFLLDFWTTLSIWSFIGLTPFSVCKNLKALRAVSYHENSSALGTGGASSWNLYGSSRAYRIR